MTVEGIAAQAERPFDLSQVQLLLDYPIEPTPNIAPGEYDERTFICRQVIDAKETMRAQLSELAAVSAIAVTPDEVTAWEPTTEHELMALKHVTRRERQYAHMVDGITQYIQDGRMDKNTRGTPLWNNQKNMVHGTARFMLSMPRTTEKGGKAGYIGSPPGSGKTGVIASICDAVKYKEDPNDPIKIIVIENTINVMHQTHGQAGNRGFGKFAKHLDVGVRYMFEKDLNHQIIIMPAASFNLLMEEGKMPDADLVIADEADVYAGGTIGRQLKAYCEDKMLIACSATVDEKTRALAPHEIYNMDLPEGIHDGILAPTVGEVLHVSATIDESKLSLDPKERKAEIEALELRARIEDAKKRITWAIERGIGVVVRCPAGDDIDVAKMVAIELRKMSVNAPNDGTASPIFKTMIRKIRALAIGGSEQTTAAGKRLQQAAFVRYDDRKADVFLYVRAIGRGWDSRHAKMFIDLDTSGPWQEKLQGFGRATRLDYDEDGIPRVAYLYSYYDENRPDQYTCVMALGGQPGQDKISLTREKKRRPEGSGGPRVLVAERVGAIAATTVERVSVEHKQVEHPAPRMPTNFKELQAYLLISPVALKGIYASVGLRLDTELDATDIEYIFFEYPLLKPQQLPEGVQLTAVDSLLALPGMPAITEQRLRHIAGGQNVRFQKFTDQEGTTKFYVTDDEALLLHAHLKTDKT